MNFLELLRKATTARLINWNPSGEELEVYLGENNVIQNRGYTATIEGVKITTTVRPRKQKNGRCIDFVCGIVIENDWERMVLTEDPEIIPGTKEDRVFPTFFHIQNEMEGRDLIKILRRTLAAMLASP